MVTVIIVLQLILCQDRWFLESQITPLFVLFEENRIKAELTLTFVFKSTYSTRLWTHLFNESLCGEPSIFYEQTVRRKH